MGTPSEDEVDMLATAFQPSANSRLACQLKVDMDCEGLTVVLPAETRTVAEDGYEPVFEAKIQKQIV